MIGTEYTPDERDCKTTFFEDTTLDEPWLVIVEPD